MIWNGVTAIADDSGVVTAQSGLHCMSDKKVSEIGDLSGYDGLVIPGGPIDNDQNGICPVIRELISDNKPVAAICFAPQFLGRAGTCLCGLCGSGV